jgi:hypothetical protein
VKDRWGGQRGATKTSRSVRTLWLDSLTKSNLHGQQKYFANEWINHRSIDCSYQVPEKNLSSTRTKILVLNPNFHKKLQITHLRSCKNSGSKSEENTKRKCRTTKIFQNALKFCRQLDTMEKRWTMKFEQKRIKTPSPAAPVLRAAVPRTQNFT